MIQKISSREDVFNRLREDTALGNSDDRTLSSNRWADRGTLLQNILDNWTDFQEIWDEILEEKVDSEIRGQVIGVQKQMQMFNFFLEIWPGLFALMHADNLYSTLQYSTHVIKLSKLQKYIFQCYKV